MAHYWRTFRLSVISIKAICFSNNNSSLQLQRRVLQHYYGSAFLQPRLINAFHEFPVLQAGHNKWSKIKYKKKAADMERSKLFSKHVRQIMAAVKAGGTANPELNIHLSSIISAARNAGVPKTNIENALRSCSASPDGQQEEPILYEGRGPSGYAILITATTSNRNRTTPEMRHLLEKHG